MTNKTICYLLFTMTTSCLLNANNWPNEGITFKFSDITADEMVTKDTGDSTLIIPGIGMFGPYSAFKEESSDSYEATISKTHFESRKESRFIAGFYINEKKYRCYGMTLQQFKNQYGDQFSSNKRWAVSVHGENKQEGTPFGTITCKWKFWPII